MSNVKNERSLISEKVLDYFESFIDGKLLTFDINYLHNYEYLQIIELFTMCYPDEFDFILNVRKFLRFTTFGCPTYQHFYAFKVKVSMRKFWNKRVKTYRKRAANMYAMRKGLLGANPDTGKNRYITDENLEEYREKQNSIREMMAKIFIFDQSTGKRLSMLGVYDKSQANPQNRYNELMLRIHGYQEYAKQNGMAAYFWTITCPSSFHSCPGSVVNKKYSGAEPLDSKNHLQKVWARFRSACARDGINIIGLQVTEPHRDGCTHRHILIFFAPQHADRVHERMSYQALKVDGCENGAAPLKGHNHLSEGFTYFGKGNSKIPNSGSRFKSVKLDPNKAGAAGYVAKYIGKNTGANRGEVSHAEQGERIRGFSSDWAIRQKATVKI